MAFAVNSYLSAPIRLPPAPDPRKQQRHVPHSRASPFTNSVWEGRLMAPFLSLIIRSLLQLP